MNPSFPPGGIPPENGPTQPAGDDPQQPVGGYPQQPGFGAASQYPFGQPAQNSFEPAQKRRRRWLIPLVVGLVAVVAIAVGVGAVLLWPKKQNGGYAGPVGVAPQYIVDPIITVGKGPTDVAVDPQSHAIYVPNSGDNTISVIDGTTYAVTTTITGITSPYRLALNSAKHVLYATSASADGARGTVAVVDTVANKVVTTVPVGENPGGIAFDPDRGLIYVVNQNLDPHPPDKHLHATNPGSVSVIDAATNSVTQTIGMGRGPQYAALDTNAHRLYISNEAENSIAVVDTMAGTVVANIGVGKDPTGVTVDPDTHTLYVANLSGPSISVIDTQTNTVPRTLNVGRYPSAVAVDKVRKTIYVAHTATLADPDATVSADAIDATTFGLVPVPGVGTQPSSIAVDAGNGAVFIVDARGAKVYVVKPCYTCAALPSTTTKPTK